MNTGLRRKRDGLSRWMPAFAGMTQKVCHLLLLAALIIAAPAVAEVPKPVVPKASGQCVEDPAVMRRNHMEFLKHQRDDTMRQGIRGAKYGLTGCLDCHAVKGADGTPVTIADPQHFCRSCHSYVGVKPDCFQCHKSVPEKAR